MKNYFFKKLFLLLLIYCSSLLGKEVTVQGYTKQDGTVVNSYTRTSPNNTTSDNWSTKGNINPYTGKAGTFLPSMKNDGEQIYYNTSGNFGYSSTTIEDTVYSPKVILKPGFAVSFKKVDDSSNSLNYYVNNDLTNFAIYKWIDHKKVTHYCDHPPP
ncbi:TPA: hypothetical protein ACULYW_001748 [Legionella pneumophila]